jgi:hypothetical protein
MLEQPLSNKNNTPGNKTRKTRSSNPRLGRGLIKIKISGESARKTIPLDWSSAMRKLMLTGGLLMLAGCTGFGLPRHDPTQAWIDLESHQEDTALLALEVDNKAATDKRYFEVQPGSHELTVRYQFPVQPTNIGPDAEPLWRDCQMNVKFSDFNAGERYQLQAGNIGFRPWAKLYDQQRKVIGQGTPTGCQRT